MPSNLIRNTGTFGGIDNVLASEIGLRSPRMLSLDLANFTPLNGDHVVLKPGTVLCQLASGLGRAYPASKAAATTATSSPTVTVNNPTVFKVGDVLVNQAGAALGTIQAINATTGVITLAANSATAIALTDFVVANDASAGTFYGIAISEIDLTNQSNDVACYTSASVYRERLPFWSTALSTAFPEITLIDPIIS